VTTNTFLLVSVLVGEEEKGRYRRQRGVGERREERKQSKIGFHHAMGLSRLGHYYHHHHYYHYCHHLLVAFVALLVVTAVTSTITTTTTMAFTRLPLHRPLLLRPLTLSSRLFPSSYHHQEARRSFRRPDFSILNMAATVSADNIIDGK